MARIPDKPTLDGLEARWSAVWEDDGTYRFDRIAPAREIFSIDTPPPTVSGSLHMGSAFGYVQTDSIARYQRMRGRHVFYPMGWDDNGLPTERRVQNYFGVRCEPHLPYDPDFVPPEKPGKDVDPDLAAELPRAVRAAGRRGRSRVRGALAPARALGRLEPHVHDDRARGAAHEPARVPAQPRARRGVPGRRADALGRRLPHRGRAGRARRPRDAGRVPRVALPQGRRFRRRPHRHHPARAARRVRRGRRAPRRRALPAAVRRRGDHAALRRARAGRRAPSRRSREGHRHRDDLHVRRHDRRRLVARAAAADARRSSASTAGSRPIRPRGSRPSGASRTREIAGRNAKQAQKIVVEQLQASGELDGDPRPITHPVKFFEKGERPLEIVTSRQWYLRNGGRDLDLRAELLALGERAALAPADDAGALRHLARRAQRRLAREPPALLRRAVPGLVPRRRRRQLARTTTRCCRPTTRCRSTRPPTARPASPRTSATSPAGSPPIPT